MKSKAIEKTLARILEIDYQGVRLEKMQEDQREEKEREIKKLQRDMESEYMHEARMQGKQLFDEFVGKADVEARKMLEEGAKENQRIRELVDRNREQLLKTAFEKTILRVFESH